MDFMWFRPFAQQSASTQKYFLASTGPLEIGHGTMWGQSALRVREEMLEVF